VEVFITGLVAGIALAIPLGPMAILLISTTIKHGRSIGVFGALAMASVDFSYAALVFAFGNAVLSALSSWIVPMRILGSAILVFVAIRIFLAARRDSRLESPEMGNDPTNRTKTYAKFFGLTILNPATAFYFVGITPSVASMASSSSLSLGVISFAGGVFIGSVVWQLSLVFAAQLTAKFTDVKVQHRIQYAGALLIFLLSIGLLLQK
jgi:threonine/homoserine/homoserine lactone efflux protein